MTQADLRVAEEHLAKQDPILGAIIKHQDIQIRQSSHHYFRSLCASVINQQISVAAAAAVRGRFEAKTNYDPATIRSLSVDELRGVGLSRQKASYVQDIASNFLANPDVYEQLDALSDGDVTAELTKIRGIGVWTAQMFLMDSLGRLDVFAPDDLALQKSMVAIYDWDVTPPKKELIEFAQKWSPYSTVACWHLWHYISNPKNA